MENILIRWTHGRPEHSYPLIVISSYVHITKELLGGGLFYFFFVFVVFFYLVSLVVWGVYEKILLRYGDITITGDGHLYLTLIAI